MNKYDFPSPMTDPCMLYMDIYGNIYHQYTINIPPMLPYIAYTIYTPNVSIDNQCIDPCNIYTNMLTLVYIPYMDPMGLKQLH